MGNPKQIPELPFSQFKDVLTSGGKDTDTGKKKPL